MSLCEAAGTNSVVEIRRLMAEEAREGTTRYSSATLSCGRNALLSALIHTRYEAAVCLLSYPLAKTVLAATDLDGRTALHAAACADLEEIQPPALRARFTRAVLAACDAAQLSLADVVDAEDWTPLTAFLMGHEGISCDGAEGCECAAAVVEALLARGSGIEGYSWSRDRGGFCQHIAVEIADTKWLIPICDSVLARLVDAGVDGPLGVDR